MSSKKKPLRLGGSGCRVWTWNGEALVSDGEVWPTATMYARCDECPEVPGPTHDCGGRAESFIWVIERIGEFIPGHLDLFGRVIKDGDQYRAQAARMREIHVGLPHEVAQVISAKYPEAEVAHVGCMPPNGPPCEYWCTA
ncbi:MAG: hypothetical protein Q8Q52_00455 [Acidimicrobiia bacterium]|nr:hypothetical protein [Acidimicrobiia bacterium]